MTRTQTVLRPRVARAMTCCLLSWSTLLAQEAPPPTRLNLVVVQGEGSADRAGARADQIPTVRVEDQDNRPVSSAVVVFTLPTAGPTGEFEGGAKSVTILSDQKGVAVARGLKVNEVPGTMQILVNVNYRGQTASATITQFIVAPNGVATPRKSHGKLVVVLLAVAGGGAAGAVLATKKSSNPASTGGGGTPGSPGGGGGGTPATIVLTIGSGSVGHP